VNTFSVFDIGVILRHIFDYDFTNYLDNSDVYNNYNFPTWFKYDINNVISIKSETDPLSDENISNLNINSKLNDFFTLVGNSYENFSKYCKDSSIKFFEVNYLNFVKEEEMLYNEIKTNLSNFIDSNACKANNMNEMLVYSYTQNFITSVNCLCEMYNNDLVNVIKPLYKQLRDIDLAILRNPNKVFDDSSEYQNIKRSLLEETYLSSSDSGSDFKYFFEHTYTDAFSALNRGVAYQSGIKPTFVEDNSGNKKYYPEKESGALNYIFNIHNFLLNLILRAFYYWNRLNDLTKTYGNKILNNFDSNFDNIVPNASTTYVKDGVLTSSRIVTFDSYKDNLYVFITDALSFYKTNISNYCYQHLELNMAYINYTLQSSNHYIYNNNNKNLLIQKGEELKQTFVLFKNMLQSVKNGEFCISNINNIHKYISDIAEIYPDNLKSDVEGGGFWSVSPNIKSNTSLQYHNPVYDKIISSLNNYFNTVFYFDNARLYGCFSGPLTDYFSDSGGSKQITAPGSSSDVLNSSTSTLISNVNNLDSSGNISQHGAIVNCINDTISYNKLINTSKSPGVEKYDIVGIIPFNKGASNKGTELETYSCYAGHSRVFESENKKDPAKLADMNKCSLNYTDSSGNLNPEFNSNLTNNTVLYKLDTTTVYDNSAVSFLGCYKKNIPEMGVYNTLPHFIGTINGLNFLSSTEIMNKCSSLVKSYNDAMGTNFDIYGITTNANDTLLVDCYAGTQAFDAKHALTSKNDAYQQDCNIYYPGTDNFMIFQNIDELTDPCLPKEVSNLENYNKILTNYLNSNITKQQKVLNEMGSDLNILNNLFPIKFAVSGIANTKNYASLIIENSMPDIENKGTSSIRNCNLKIMVKEGPPGIKGEIGASGEKGPNTKGPPGNIGNAGYWGGTKS
jgi:hypothetical protein